MRASILITPLAPLLACACLLAGCGQKGPLYLPPETPIRQATPVVTMPASQEGADETDAADETGAATSSTPDAATSSSTDSTPSRATTHDASAGTTANNRDTDATRDTTAGTTTRKGTDE